MKISIVIPVYNSAPTLPTLTQRIDDVLQSIGSYEIILVDDHSQDHSFNVLAGLAKNNNHLKIIKLDQNYGQQNAIFAGLHYCSGDIIITMDDDLQHDCEDLIDLIATVEKGYDLVYAIDDNRNVTNYKTVGGWVRSLFFKWNYPQLNTLKVSSYRAFDRKLLADVLTCDYRFIYLSAILLPLTDRVTNIQVNRNHRHHGTSNYDLYQLIKLFLKLIFYYSKVSFVEQIKPKGKQYTIERTINL
jgi:undecaprenyl-phosphate 4-deoxy-4-formamido-L-arabinose transferase